MTARHTLSLDNVRLLQQGVDLLSSIDDELYVHADARISDSCVGSHMRHCIDFYQRFLGGVYSGKVDYDKRERDPRIESDRAHAIVEMESIERALQAFGEGPEGMRLEVQSDAGTGDKGHWAFSSVERELQVLASHTVHHYALIAVILRSVGHDPGRGFGVAPSTLRYWEETGACAR
ncbi:MAG: DinB family protein [Planctomycetes bacterium]|nr:DinB family protein [Planctomycetota bacterium]MCB9905998.1 DinB family protein [Planctomycetota bacterium]